MSLNVGGQCSLSSCNTIDFLPILCSCDQYYCRDHILPDSHSCSFQQSPPSTTGTATKLARCDWQGCNKPSLESFAAPGESSNSNRVRSVCEGCQKSFCAQHRHPKSHSCEPTSATAETTKNAKAQALLAKHFPAKSAPVPEKRAPKIPTDPAKLAKYKQVELIKLRHQAKSGDPTKKPGDVVVGDRLHVKVSVDTSSKQMDDKPIWFVKTVSVGKALDCLVKQFDVPRPSPPRRLALYLIPFSDANSRIELATDVLLSSTQVEDASRLIICTTTIESTDP